MNKISNDHDQTPKWQCVAICWGTKFTSDHLRSLFDQVERRTSVPAAFVLLTDHIRADLPDHIHQRIIDPFYMQPRFMAGGAQTKLAQFVHGTLPFDVTTVFFDLDTLVLGDAYRVALALKDPNHLLMLGNSSLVFSRAARIAKRLSGGHFRSRGNSSVMCYVPSQNHHIDVAFRAQFGDHPTVSKKAMAADDKFISWIDHDRLRRLSGRIAVKFPLEFMRRFAWQTQLAARLPWVRNRRASLAVVTFPGKDADIEILRRLGEGSTLRDAKNRQLLWNDLTAFPVKQTLS